MTRRLARRLAAPRQAARWLAARRLAASVRSPTRCETVGVAAAERHNCLAVLPASSRSRSGLGSWAKLLTRPTGKDFHSIIRFLFAQVDPGCTLPHPSKIKFDETKNIPFVLKMLGYPFGVSKTALVAVGSPHTWPALLATITWLVELLTYDEEVRASRRRVARGRQDADAARG